MKKKRPAPAIEVVTPDLVAPPAATAPPQSPVRESIAKRPPARKSKAAARADLRARVDRIVELLKREYPEAECALDFATPLQLLVATILSAQCTDKRVNLVTPDLFAAYPDARALADAPRAEIERLIKTAGFFRAKAKNIQECCRALVDRHGGEVPRSLDELVKLAGVGRKTANVVLGVAYKIASGVVVDTHVGRLSRRLGLTRSNDAVKVENDLRELLPESEWIDWSHRLIYHGRRVCHARKPLCGACRLEPLCPKVGVAVKKPAAAARPKAAGSARGGKSRGRVRGASPPSG